MQQNPLKEDEILLQTDQLSLFTYCLNLILIPISQTLITNVKTYASYKEVNLMVYATLS